MSRSRRVSGWFAAGLVGLAALSAPALAATVVVAGSVSDAASGARLAGASLSIRLGGTELGSALTDGEGVFRMPFEIAVRPETQSLKLLVNADAYVGASRDVAVTGGRATPVSFALKLMPRAVADCVRQREHSVVVGYFRPAASSSADPDVAARVAEALSYDLLPRLQQGRLAAELLPSILACGSARPRALEENARYAEALRADVFLVGSVNDASLRKVKVEMTVSDRFGVLPQPQRISNREVNLDDPSLARLDAAAHAAILTALLAGYERSGRPAECVDFANAAERIVGGTLPAALADARRRCAVALPNRGLLP